MRLKARFSKRISFEKIPEQAQRLKSNRVVLISSGASLALIIAQVIFLVFFLKNLPPEIPLFYSLTWGAKQLASSRQLFLLPILCLMIFLTNALFLLLMGRDKAVIYLLTVSTLVSTVLIMITFVKIVLLTL